MNLVAQKLPQVSLSLNHLSAEVEELDNQNL